MMVRAVTAVWPLPLSAQLTAPYAAQACNFGAGEQSTLCVALLRFWKVPGPKVVPDQVFAHLHDTGEIRCADVFCTVR